MKNKSIAIINLIIGTPCLVLLLVVNFFIYPRIHELYSELDVRLPVSTKYFPVYSGVLSLAIIYILFTNVRLLRESVPSNKLDKQSIFSLVFLLILVFLLRRIVLLLILPIYN